MADLKPGDYRCLYLDNILVHAGLLKEQGTMESGRCRGIPTENNNSRRKIFKKLLRMTSLETLSRP